MTQGAGGAEGRGRHSAERRGSGGPRGGGPDRRGQRPPRGDQRSSRTQSRNAEQRRYDGPPIPEDVTGSELDRDTARQLAGLPEKLAARVAAHLVAAGRALSEDPEVAYQHALAARARAARVAVVREAVGETAYAAGHYAEALSELRAARRMNGAVDYLPVVADCERAVGRPTRAIDLAHSDAVAKLSKPARVEMRIVEAGARADLGQLDQALRTLESGPLRTESREAWAVRIRYAYADLLQRAGRDEESVEWFHRTAAIDADGLTDAEQRVAELEG